MKGIRAINSLNTTIARSGLFSIAVRNYYPQKSFYLSEDFRKEIVKKLDPVAHEFSEHKALKHPLFVYLEERSKEGFTAKQFLIYRDNFFRRSQLEIPSIASTLRASVLYGDFDAAVLGFKNLSNKMGGGNVKKIHSQLLLESHNIHGIRVFGLDPVARMTDVEKSEVLLPEVEEYRKAKEDIFTRQYPVIAGNTWAHELAADSMLDNFRKAFFDPYKSYYEPKEYKNIARFFTVHKDQLREDKSVEKQHEKMARKTVESACLESLTHIEQVREGGLIFLDHQAKLWDGMLRELEKARNIVEIIKPRESREVIQKIDNYNEPQQKSGNISEAPNTIIKKASAKRAGYQSDIEENRKSRS
ncbi:MAG: hypothetical protein SFV53_00335 [Rickettsiales bacterium]|nr:hypothetical protein [Rickettsiales bacterium]